MCRRQSYPGRFAPMEIGLDGGEPFVSVLGAEGAFTLELLAVVPVRRVVATRGQPADTPEGPPRPVLAGHGPTTLMLGERTRQENMALTWA